MSYPIADRISKSISPAVTQMKQKAGQLEAKGIDLIYMLRGEPDFNTPSHIREAATKSLLAGQTHYPPPNGIPGLRQAIADRMLRDFELSLNPDEEIIVTTGATMGIYTAIQAIVDPGDEVIFFDPIYDPYRSVISMTGGVPVSVPAIPEKGHFFVPLDRISKVISQNTKAILVNNPWNPTGSVMALEELHALIELADRHNFILIVDEIYEHLVFEGHQHHCLASISPQARKRTITINSFSKSYAMTGWRLGYNIAPPKLAKAMLSVAHQFSRSATNFVQHAGISALRESQEATQTMVNIYAQRRDYLTRKLSELESANPHPPEGTFFYFVDIRSYGKDSQSISDYLLNQAHVVTIPGSVYGPGGEGYIRLSFAYDETVLEKGMEAIVKALNNL
jgi:aspartate/methionine/tyrosine aminotransferase